MAKLDGRIENGSFDPAKNRVKIGAKRTRPPYRNTGVRSAKKKSLTACIDWLNVTFKDCKNWEEIAEFLQLNPMLFEVKDRGRNGYTKSAILDNIKIFYAGNEDMGVLLELSGAGCREYEQRFEDGLNWSIFIAKCLRENVNISRIDIALDDFDKRIKFKTVMRKIKNGEVSSRLKTGSNYSRYMLSDGEKRGETIYFGESDVIIRFYDKKEERLAKGYEMAQDLDSWQRYEVQLRDDRALTLAREIAKGGESIGVLVKRVLKHYLAFKIKDPKQSNKSRWKIARFWSDFLGDVNALSFSQVAPEQSIMRKKIWISNQVATSYAMLRQALGDDDLLDEYIRLLGGEKMNTKQARIVENFQEDTARHDAMRKEISEEVDRMRFASARKEASPGWGFDIAHGEPNRLPSGTSPDEGEHGTSILNHPHWYEGDSLAINGEI